MDGLIATTGRTSTTASKPQRPDLVAKAIKPDYAIGSHVAALGLWFSEKNALPEKYQGGAFVSEHGSWDRSPLSGYEVVHVAFKHGKPVGQTGDRRFRILFGRREKTVWRAGGSHAGSGRRTADCGRCGQCSLARYGGLALSNVIGFYWFTLVPLFSFIGLFAAAIAILCISGELMSAYLHQVQVSALVSSRIDWMAQVFFLWVLPVSIGAAFAVFAYRRRVALHWPITGIAIVCCLVALINASVVLTGGTPPGSVDAGIGISAHSMPGQLAHAVAIFLPVVGPLWVVCRRHRADGATVD